MLPFSQIQIRKLLHFLVPQRWLKASVFLRANCNLCAVMRRFTTPPPPLPRHGSDIWPCTVPAEWGDFIFTRTWRVEFEPNISFFCLNGRICAWVFFRLVCGSWTDVFQEQDLAFLSEGLTQNELQSTNSYWLKLKMSLLKDIWSWTTFWPRRAGIWTSQFSIKSKCQGGVGVGIEVSNWPVQNFCHLFLLNYFTLIAIHYVYGPICDPFMSSNIVLHTTNVNPSCGRNLPL